MSHRAPTLKYQRKTGFWFCFLFFVFFFLRKMPGRWDSYLEHKWAEVSIHRQWNASVPAVFTIPGDWQGVVPVLQRSVSASDVGVAALGRKQVHVCDPWGVQGGFQLGCTGGLVILLHTKPDKLKRWRFLYNFLNNSSNRRYWFTL